ncbi:Prolyl 3-hydroxylase ogfod1, partial [Blyttiomyces sp. JEL0837]
SKDNDKKGKEAKGDDDEDEEEDDDVPLTEDEILELAPFINPSYLKPSVIAQANEKFVSESSIQLTHFLRTDLATAISEATTKADIADQFLPSNPDKPLLGLPPVPDYEKGVGSRVGKDELLPDENVVGGLVANDPVGVLFNRLRHELFSSTAFRRFIYLVTSLKTVSGRCRVRRFRPGIDYTLATSTMKKEKPVHDDEDEMHDDDEDEDDGMDGILDATLCFVHDKSRLTKSIWESDDVGGFECFMAPDEGNDDPAQYRVADAGDGYGNSVGDGGALLNVSASSNTLSLVMREPGVMKFVKYVGARAPGSRWDIAYEYRFE